MIHLYRFRFSTNVERVTLALAHKNLEVESIWVNPRDRSPVEQLSGQRLVPVIDDGRVVSDSTAILRYLEERYPQPPLYPHEEAQRAAVDIYIDWFNRVCKRPPNEIETELLADKVDQQRVDELAAWMARNLDVHERLLAGRDYLFGDDFSAADCAAFPFLKYALARDSEDDELFHRILDEHQSVVGRPRLEAWIQRVDERPRV
ncbi:MAG TPA: glutathione S-transferase family protein [Gaiellaceae bacterium]